MCIIYEHFKLLLVAICNFGSYIAIWQSLYYTFNQISQYRAKYAFYTNFVNYIVAAFAYYAGIMLNAFATPPQNYAGIISSSLQLVIWIFQGSVGELRPTVTKQELA